MKTSTTEVFELKTTDEVERFCRALLSLKNQAPISLRVIVSITASRDVKPRGGDGIPDLTKLVHNLLD